MPIHEYECRSCRILFQKLVMKSEEEEALLCPGCGSPNLKKLLSRVAYHVSEADRLAGFDPARAQDDGFYRDSRNIGLHAKKRARQMGLDLGETFEGKLDKLRTNPGSVIKDSE